MTTGEGIDVTRLRVIRLEAGSPLAEIIEAADAAFKEGKQTALRSSGIALAVIVPASVAETAGMAEMIVREQRERSPGAHVALAEEGLTWILRELAGKLSTDDAAALEYVREVLDRLRQEVPG